MRLSELRKYRKIAKKTQAYVAEYAGITRTQYGRIENGESKPKYDVLTRIMEAINCECRILIKEEIVN